jgi:ribosomal protein L32
MAFGPKKKHSKHRSKQRTSNWIKLTARKLFNRVSLNAQGNGLSHFADENGVYKGEQITAAKKSKQKVTRI